MRTLIDEFLKESPENRRLFQQERVTLDATEMIWGLINGHVLQSREIKEKLAKLLGTSVRNLTRMLNGDRRLTLHQVSDILGYFNKQLVISCVDACPTGE